MTNLQATTTAPKKIVITWDSAVGEDFSHYNVYRTMSKILPYTYLSKTTSNSYEDLLNSNGTQRYYKVTVVDKDGLESLKQDEPVLGQTLAAPAAPTFTSVSFDGSGANLSWNGVERATSYTLYREGGSERTINGITGTSYTDTSVQPGATYTYQIIAVDEFGIGSDKSAKVEISIK